VDVISRALHKGDVDDMEAKADAVAIDKASHLGLVRAPSSFAT
jgi:hypothetical protein